MTLRLLIILLAVLQCACVPILFATPPVEVQVGAAGAVHEEAEFAVPVRVDAQPMQLVREQKDRKFDFGLGYLFVPGTGSYLHGPGLNVGILQGSEHVPQDEQPGLALRWGGAARANLMYSGSGFDQNGWGVGLQGRIEWVRYSAGPFSGCNDNDDEYYPPPAREPSQDPYPAEPHYDDDDDEPALSCFTGWAEGETAFGFFVEASRASIGNETFMWFGGGILFRLPASAAAGFATIF